MLGQPDVVVADDVSSFAGIAPPTLLLYPIETHIAEKLHAYTIPRVRPNLRVKDLPALTLLATAQRVEASRVRDALGRGDGTRRLTGLANARRRHRCGPCVSREPID